MRVAGSNPVVRSIVSPWSEHVFCVGSAAVSFDQRASPIKPLSVPQTDFCCLSCADGFRVALRCTDQALVRLGELSAVADAPHPVNYDQFG